MEGELSPLAIRIAERDREKDGGREGRNKRERKGEFNTAKVLRYQIKLP